MNSTVLPSNSTNDHASGGDDVAMRLLQQLGGIEMIGPDEARSLIEGGFTVSLDACLTELVRRNLLTAFQRKIIDRGGVDALEFGRYVLLDEIGRGGIGRVFKVHHRGLKRVAALKILARKHAQARDFVRRFGRETVASARLDHPNITTAFDAGDLNRRPYLVMEYVEGEDLSQFVARSGPLPIATAIDLVLQAARGLEYAHQQGVLHRDIKPANLIVDVKGLVKITDFGLARIQVDYGDVELSELTRVGVGMGTVDYVAPEQATNARDVDARADIYSLGATLFYLVRGVPMYQGSVIDRLLAHRQLPIPPLVEESSERATELEALFRRMVAKKPDDRFRTMGEVIRELERLKLTAEQPRPPVPASRDQECERLAEFLQNLRQSPATASGVPVIGSARKSAADDSYRDGASSTRLTDWPSRLWTRLFSRWPRNRRAQRRQSKTVVFPPDWNGRAISRA